MGLKKVDTCSSKKPLINPQAQKDGSVARSSKNKNHQGKSTFIIAGHYKRAKDNCVSSYQVSNSEIGFLDDKSLSGLSYGTNDVSRVNSGKVKQHIDNRIEALRQLKKDQNIESSRNTNLV